MFDPTFDPYGLLMELLERVQRLEQRNANLVRHNQAQAKTLENLIAAHTSLTQQHKELVEYVTAKASRTKD